MFYRSSLYRISEFGAVCTHNPYFCKVITLKRRLNCKCRVFDIGDVLISRHLILDAAAIPFPKNPDESGTFVAGTSGALTVTVHVSVVPATTAVIVALCSPLQEIIKE